LRAAARAERSRRAASPDTRSERATAIGREPPVPNPSCPQSSGGHPGGGGHRMDSRQKTAGMTEGMGCGNPVSARHFVVQVSPRRVVPFDQPNLPRSVPLLEPLLPFDGRLCRAVHLVVDKSINAVLRCEAAPHLLLVFPYPLGERRSHANVQRPVSLARKNVDRKLFFHSWHIHHKATKEETRRRSCPQSLGGHPLPLPVMPAILRRASIGREHRFPPKDCGNDRRKQSRILFLPRRGCTRRKFARDRADGTESLRGCKLPGRFGPG
jgi:hypothetical protein